MRAWLSLVVGMSACDDAATRDAEDTTVEVEVEVEAEEVWVAPPCEAVMPRECPTPAPTYTNDIAVIIDTHCGRCHDGLHDTWRLQTYAQVSGFGDKVRDEVLACTMPPRDEPTFVTTADRQRILEWIQCGMPE